LRISCVAPSTSAVSVPTVRPSRSTVPSACLTLPHQHTGDPRPLVPLEPAAALLDDWPAVAPFPPMDLCAVACPSEPRVRDVRDVHTFPSRAHLSDDLSWSEGRQVSSAGRTGSASAPRAPLRRHARHRPPPARSQREYAPVSSTSLPHRSMVASSGKSLYERSQGWRFSSASAAGTATGLAVNPLSIIARLRTVEQDTGASVASAKRLR
jgi:hypothetical protein